LRHCDNAACETPVSWESRFALVACLPMSLATIFSLKAAEYVFLTMSVAFSPPGSKEAHATTTLTQGVNVNLNATFDVDLDGITELREHGGPTPRAIPCASD
jgi:hypothetical protein